MLVFSQTRADRRGWHAGRHFDAELLFRLGRRRHRLVAGASERARNHLREWARPDLALIKQAEQAARDRACGFAKGTLKYAIHPVASACRAT